MLPSKSPTQVLPSRVEDLSYRDLTGLVKREDESMNGVQHSGGFADIFVGYLTEGNKTVKVRGNIAHSTSEISLSPKVAIKVLRMVNDEGLTTKVKKLLIRETAAWHQLHHHNVLEFLGLAPDHARYGCPALISPYCERGTATKYLASHSDIDTKLSIITGTAEGLKYLHQNEVVHGDLKPSNVLIHDDGHPLLCDFGRSKILTSGGFTTNASGACRYQAPELLISNDGPKKSSDIYALATTAYEFWTGLEPFSDIHTDSSIIISIVMRDARPEYPDIAPVGTEYMWRLFEDSWKNEPEDRLEATEVVERLNRISNQLR
ncbi:hypothetical protein D9756_009115 [Leucocoprinus leucothites]|uniref:Protein kinase domain-containing protein n=1 Tax=Leucocoprinus leucothites TaxID=201217 RepID=A0A8H5FUZ6_9AGAR|nr:hypothetical protein D9756_009115 [Leucoagaricus leucothites]